MANTDTDTNTKGSKLQQLAGYNVRSGQIQTEKQIEMKTQIQLQKEVSYNN